MDMKPSSSGTYHFGAGVDAVNGESDTANNCSEAIAVPAHPPDLVVEERFTRVADDILDYEFTVNDPNVWTQPWKGSLPMWRNSEPLYEYACHEGNYGLFNILAGSRAEEAAAAAK